MSAGTHEAICLRRGDLAEDDAVVTFLTREAGKLAVVARGVRRPRSKLAPICQTLCRGRIQIAPGRRLGVLAQVVVEQSYYALRQSLLAAAHGAYVAELCALALPDGEPYPEVFDLLVATLDGLQEAADGTAWVLSFELRLIALLGYAPVLDAAARDGRELGEEALLCPAAGGLIAPDQRQAGEVAIPAEPRVIRALRRLLSPEAYGLELSDLRLPPALVEPLREATGMWLRYHLEAEPKSRAFLDHVRRLEADGGDP